MSDDSDDRPRRIQIRIEMNMRANRMSVLQSIAVLTTFVTLGCCLWAIYWAWQDKVGLAMIPTAIALVLLMVTYWLVITRNQYKVRCGRLQGEYRFRYPFGTDG